VLNQFTAVGFRKALVQRKNEIKTYLDSAWTLGIIRGLVLYAILFLSAPLAAYFFESPQAVTLIRVIGFSMIINAFANIGTVIFQKELDFKKSCLLLNSGTFADATVAIILTVIFRDVWALVAGQLVGAVTRCALSYALHPYRPRLSFDLGKISELWEFGRHVMATSILKFFIMQGDDIFLAKMLGAYTLGLYRYAYKISNLVATEIGDIVSSVTFPAFSKLQDDIKKLKDGYIKTIQLVSLITYPVAGGIVILSHELIIVVFGVKWFEMASTMQILCILGVAKCMQGGVVFNSLKRPDISVRISIIRLALIVISIYPLTRLFGMPGTALSVTISSLAIIPFLLYYVKKFIAHSPIDFVGIVSLPLIATLAMMNTVFLARLCFDNIGIIALLILITVGAISYCVYVMLLAKFYREYHLVEIIRNLRKGLK